MVDMPYKLDEEIASRLEKAAIHAARVAGDIHMHHWRKTPAVARMEAHDIKLEADRLSEDAVVAILRAAMPEASIITEESGLHEGSADFVWVVDPLDGTVNYYYGQPHFCICIACYRRKAGEVLGEPVVGVVYAAAYAELFVARPGRGAQCNGEPICVRPVSSIMEAMLASSFGGAPETIARMERIIGALIRCTRKLRMLGACGLDICNVAAGRLSGLFQSSVRIWDFAAARIILEEAGGVVDARALDAYRWDILATAPGITDELRAIVYSQ